MIEARAGSIAREETRAMARDLAIFMVPLLAATTGEAPEGGEGEEPGLGLDAADPRLISIIGLATAGKLGEAADQVEELFSHRIYDIRAISIYLFAAFREGGTAVLPGVLAACSNLLGESFEAVGPEKRREDHYDRRL